MSKYIKLEDAIKCVNNVHNLADFIKKAICEEIEDMSSADAIERKALNEFMEKYADLKIRYKEALNYVPYDFEKRFEDYDMTIDDLPTIEVSEGDQVLYGTDHNCILTMFGECSYNETGCGDCAVAEKIRKALEVSEDCISREWLYNELAKVTAVTPTQIDMRSDFADIIKHAPSVVPSRAEGEWIYIDEPIMGNPYGRYRCSECEMDKPHKTDYCPNCGAKMRLE